MRPGRPRARRGAPFDLFGEIPVTWPEVAAWCAAVAGIGPDSWRFGYYVRGWNVPDKIRAAKLAGTFEMITAQTRQDRPGVTLNACGPYPWPAQLRPVAPAQARA